MLKIIEFFKNQRRKSLVVFFGLIAVVSAAGLLYFYWPLIEYNFNQIVQAKNQTNNNVGETAKVSNSEPADESAKVLESITGTDESGKGNTTEKSAKAKSAAAPAPKSSGDYLVIKKIGVEIPVVEGPDARALSSGAWLLPGTSAPDEMGNTVLAGHRFLYRPPSKKTFYLLDKVAVGDTLSVFWKGKEYRYIVAWIKIVDPTDVSVLQKTDNPSLTLITCTPLFTDEKRLIVRGELEGVY